MVQGIWQRPRVLHLARTSGRCLGPELAGSEKLQRSRRGLSATYFERDQICPAPRKLECQAAESVCPVTASSGRGRGIHRRRTLLDSEVLRKQTDLQELRGRVAEESNDMNENQINSTEFNRRDFLKS